MFNWGTMIRKLWGRKIVESSTCGRFMVDYLTQSLNIKESMLAALLDITPHQLHLWRKVDNELGKFRRLVKLYEFIIYVKSTNLIPDTQLYNLLHQPLENTEHSKTIMYYIVDSKILQNRIMRKAVRAYQDDKL